MTIGTRMLRTTETKACHTYHEIAKIDGRFNNWAHSDSDFLACENNSLLNLDSKPSAQVHTHIFSLSLLIIAISMNIFLRPLSICVIPIQRTRVHLNTRKVSIHDSSRPISPIIIRFISCCAFQPRTTMLLYNSQPLLLVLDFTN